MKSIFIQQILSGSSLLSPAHWAGGARATVEFYNSPSVKKSGEARKQAGKKEGGLGEGIFARLPKRSPAALLVQSRIPQKSFLFLLEEKSVARKIKKCEENFFAEQRAKRAAAGRSVSSVQKRFGFRQTNAPELNFQKFCRLIRPREARQRTETLARRARRGSPNSGSLSLAILSICFAQLKTNSTNL